MARRQAGVWVAEVAATDDPATDDPATIRQLVVHRVAARPTPCVR